jgi:hypothetical protein
MTTEIDQRPITSLQGTRGRSRVPAVLVALAATVAAFSSGANTTTTYLASMSSVWSTTDAMASRRPDPYQYLPAVPGFRVTSTTVTNGKPLPAAQLSKLFGVPNGGDVSPELSWSGFPKGTKSFVVSMYDPQAPTGSGFWHWVVANIPASTTRLAENAGAVHTTQLPAGAFQLGGDAGAHQYVGAAPPKGSGVHYYYVTVTALDVPTTGLTATASGAYLGFTIGAHTIARATIICPTSAK